MKKHNTKSIWFFLFFFLGMIIDVHSQSKGTLLIISDQEAIVLVDGDTLGFVEVNQPKKFEVSHGEHYLQIIAISTDVEKNEIFAIESNQQLVRKFEFENGDETLKLSKNKVQVADIDFNIPGLVTVGASEEDFEYPVYYYAFQKGDEITINLEMTNKQGTNVIEVFTYPDLNVIYSNDDFKDLKDHKINIHEESIYGFTFATKHVFDRDVRFQIERVPSSEGSKDFNTSVEWVENFEIVTVQEPQKFFINATVNELFSEGNSRTAVPLNFPDNTVKWYYEFSAYRDEEALDKIYDSFNLVAELSNLIDKTGVLSFGLSQLSQPPGSDYCDIYLLDYDALGLFNSRGGFSYIIEGTRENYKSGIVEINYVPDEQVYLGIANRAKLYGINVAIQIVAIVKQEGWQMKENSE